MAKRGDEEATGVPKKHIGVWSSTRAGGKTQVGRNQEGQSVSSKGKRGPWKARAKTQER